MSEELDRLKLELLDLNGEETHQITRTGEVVALEDRTKRLEGRDWPADALTMIGMARLNNLQECIEAILRDDVPGDLIETGVWRGGASIFMQAVLRAHGAADRVVWAADSFEGLPPPSLPADAASKHHEWDHLAVPLEEVKQNFARYGLLDGARFVKGFFSETLPALRGHRWSLIRLDGDMYESTIAALENLYPSLSADGFLIVDDYCLRPCRKAVADYRAEQGITEEIKRIDWAGIYWQKA
jgi:O-methyltransferase